MRKVAQWNVPGVVSATKKSVLETYLTELPNALLITSAVVKNQRLVGDVIIIADEIDNVETSGGTLLAFSSSYRSVVIGDETKNNKLLMFIRANTSTINIDIRVLGSASVNLTFLSENPAQTFELDGLKMKLPEFAAWWLKNKVRGGSKTFSFDVREIEVTI